MIRDIVGVLDRSGDRADTEKLRRAVGAGAHSLESGALAVAYTGDPATAVGDSFALLDGRLDRDPRTDEEGAPGDPESALLGAWRARPGAFSTALRGAFAIVLWDGREGLLVRDQIGNRGLYYADDGRRLRFATELSLLLAILDTRPAPDRHSLAHWLNVSAPPGDRTLFEGVKHLAAAHELALTASGRRDPTGYWVLTPTEPRLAPRTEHAQRWRAALERAVTRSCGEPGETGVLLSGGIDSASVAALLSREQSVRAYSAVFPVHPSVDESALIARLAAELDLPLTRAEVRAGSPVAGALDGIERWKVPPVSPNTWFWAPLMASAADDGTRVLLDGEGGDELFGLASPLVADRLRARDVLGAVGLVYRAPGALGRPSRGSVRRYFVHAGLEPLAPAWVHALSRRVRGPRRYVPRWVGRDLARAFAETSDGGDWKRIAGPRWWAYLVNTTLTGTGTALAYDNIRQRAAGAGILARHPIMDVDVVETVLDTPPELAFDPYVTRPLLREAMAGLLPEAIRVRPSKSTFDELFHESLGGPDLQVARALLGDPRARLGAYVDLGTLRADLLDAGAPPRGGERIRWALFLWRALTAECWLRAQDDVDALLRDARAAGLAAPEVAIVTA